MQASQTRRSKPAIYTRNAFHRHPAAQAVNWHFGERANNYPEALREGVRRLYSFARTKCRDGWLTESEAVAVLACGRQRRTGRSRLDDLLTLAAHFELREGVFYLKTMFLSAKARLDTLDAYDRKRDAEALRQRAHRGAPTARDVNRRRKYGPPAPPETHSVGGAKMSREDLEASPVLKETNPRRSDPRATLCSVPAKMPAAGQAVALAMEVLPEAWEDCVALGQEAMDLFLEREYAEQDAARRAPPPKPKPKPLHRNDEGIPIILLDMGYNPVLVPFSTFTEAEWLAGREKVRHRYGPGEDQGALLVYATRALASGMFRPVRQR